MSDAGRVTDRYDDGGPGQRSTVTPEVQATVDGHQVRLRIQLTPERWRRITRAVQLAVQAARQNDRRPAGSHACAAAVMMALDAACELGLVAWELPPVSDGAPGEPEQSELTIEAALNQPPPLTRAVPIEELETIKFAVMDLMAGRQVKIDVPEELKKQFILVGHGAQRTFADCERQAVAAFAAFTATRLSGDGRNLAEAVRLLRSGDSYKQLSEMLRFERDDGLSDPILCWTGKRWPKDRDGPHNAWARLWARVASLSAEEIARGRKRKLTMLSFAQAVQRLESITRKRVDRAGLQRLVPDYFEAVVDPLRKVVVVPEDERDAVA